MSEDAEGQLKEYKETMIPVNVNLKNKIRNGEEVVKGAARSLCEKISSQQVHVPGIKFSFSFSL